MTKSTHASFTSHTLGFFKKLGANNDREWFNAHRTDYEKYVKTPMLDLLAWMNTRLSKFALDHVTEPKKAIYRLHRDTRFSKDKTPYKLNVSAMFGHRLLPKNNCAGFYFHVSADECFIGVGVYMPEPDALKTLREKIAADPKSFRTMTSSPALKKYMGTLNGEKLVRIPKNYAPDHPAADLLRMKQFCFYKTLPAKTALNPDFARQVADCFEAAAPFNAWLNDVILSCVKEVGDEPVQRRPAPMF
jgi:uncharacterized protein (TIGR02453 family)